MELWKNLLLAVTLSSTLGCNNFSKLSAAEKAKVKLHYCSIENCVSNQTYSQTVPDEEQIYVIENSAYRVNVYEIHQWFGYQPEAQFYVNDELIKFEQSRAKQPDFLSSEECGSVDDKLGLMFINWNPKPETAEALYCFVKK